MLHPIPVHLCSPIPFPLYIISYSLISIINMILHLALLCTLSSALAILCPRSSYQFISNYSLGKQDELNRTFIRIQKDLPGLDFNYTFTNVSTTYRITNFTSIFRYADTSQKAQPVGKDTIMVFDGFLRIQFSFNWTRIGVVNATGTAFGTGRTDAIAFAKNIIINSEGFPMFNLYGYYPIVWGNHTLNITRIQPHTDTDLQALEQILNFLPDEQQTLRQHWIAGVNNLMPFYLNDSLHDDYHKLEREINYTFPHPQKGNLIVTFEHFLMGIDLEPDGLNMNFSSVVKNYAEFDCGNAVPVTHRATKEYGGIQQFISLGVYKSTVAYGISKGFFDTALNQDTWQSRHFQFYAGDLYDVIPGLQKKYYPNQQLNGSCKALSTGFDLVRGGTDSLNVTMNFNCSLYANLSDKIVDIFLNSTFNIVGRALTNSTDFIVGSAEFAAQYSPGSGYSIANVDLANYYLNSTAHSIRGSRVFGSGYGTYQRDNPHFEANTDYVFLYDSASVHDRMIVE